MLLSRFVSIVVAVMSSAAQGQTTWYVDDDNCPGPGSGTEGDPYCSIQTAIDNAVDFDEIVVAPGTYYETINFLGSMITLRSSGGAEVTIIDAQQTATVVTCDSGEGPDTMVLDGFTVRNGDGFYGGGMYNRDSSPTVTNCIFSANVSDVGGGMFNWDSNPTVTNCTFINNEAEGGGGMYNFRSHPTVTNCTFSSNDALSGGGMSNLVSSPRVTNCTFSGNARDHGGGMDNFNSSPILVNCTFTGNTANSGGGMYDEDSSSTVHGCTFTGNTATSGGGGMASYASNNATVTNCTFTGNTATSGGGMGSYASNNLRVIDSTFCGNSPEDINGPVVLAGVSMSTVCPIPLCPSDTDGDGIVGVLDFLLLLEHWGPCP